MANRFSFLFSLSLVLFSTCIPQLPAEPNMKAENENLITKVCFKTRHPSFCLQALESNPGSATADLSGLAKISIDLAQASAQKTYILFGSLMETESNPQLKERYSSCYENYDIAVGAIRAANRYLNVKDYKSLNVQATAVLSAVVDCEENFETPPSEPSQVQESNQNLYDLSNIFLVISKLL